ncbi:aspartate--tRNA ligase dps1 [Metarhizium acridum]|uniref:aspartate--tRNA ligase dps1 n=1 Tax=Metarhizium acridum TaxID=92637 RepID=UPI001C6C0FD8|nr:aspartate--tRNA ligase dps1 [Metarhizium acridum]KAG8417106.1 aspartate--tRNA ligase dps1 [Metarhizium acridum]
MPAASSLLASAFGLPRSRSQSRSRTASPNQRGDVTDATYSADWTTSSTPLNSTPGSPSVPATPTFAGSAFGSPRHHPKMADSAVDVARDSARSSIEKLSLTNYRQELDKLNDRSQRSSPDRAGESIRSSMESGRTSMSADWPTHPYELNPIAELDKLPLGTEVNFRARISTQRQLSKNLDFLLFRDQTNTVQGVLSREYLDMVRWVQKLNSESLVQVNGVLKAPPEAVRSATHSGVEVEVHSIHLVNAAQGAPFTNYKPPETLRNRMTSRILDLRHPSNQALFRIRSMVTRIFRDTLEQQGFVEINTPKLQPAATESGAAVFKVNYFGRNAFLAQSPQLAKQSAVSADFGRVYEVGPVFRAENSNTHRHLTEYTGLDIEMSIEHDYHEVICIIDEFLKNVFTSVYAMPEVKEVQKRWPSKEFKWLDETLILNFEDGIQMLRDDGRDVEMEDLSTPDEIRLGELVREKYGTDYYVLDKFPASARPFYTHKDPENPFWTRSFDIFIRGQEICSGGQRIHDAAELRENMQAVGISEDGMEDYLAAFDLGAPPHAGAGLGLERIVAWMLELGDVRYASLFHRDPKSLPERAPGLPHPDADTTKPLRDGVMPPIEKLIANYGDASNTSWLDERFEIWRHPTGAAVGYVKQDKFAMITGDPLCDKSQYKDVCAAFVKFVLSKLKLTPVWMLVSYEIQKILAQQMSWRTLSCTEEQRVDATKHHSINGGGPKARRVEREGVKIHEVKPDADFIRRADEAIVNWKANRKGKQVHLTEVRPWVDMEHRRYYAAEKDGKVLAMVVLAKLSPKHGWQVKWALDFPGSVNGAIEVLIEYALSTITGQVTFGVGVSEKLTPGEHLHGIRARFLATTYASIVDSLGLRRKAGFRSKFGALGEEVYICYPKHGVGLRDLQQIIKFFQD